MTRVSLRAGAPLGRRATCVEVDASDVRMNAATLRREVVEPQLALLRLPVVAVLADGCGEGALVLLPSSAPAWLPAAVLRDADDPACVRVVHPCDALAARPVIRWLASESDAEVWIVERHDAEYVYLQRSDGEGPLHRALPEDLAGLDGPVPWLANPTSIVDVSRPAAMEEAWSELQRQLFGSMSDDGVVVRGVDRWHPDIPGPEFGLPTSTPDASIAAVVDADAPPATTSDAIVPADMASLEPRSIDAPRERELTSLAPPPAVQAVSTPPDLVAGQPHAPRPASAKPVTRTQTFARPPTLADSTPATTPAPTDAIVIAAPETPRPAATPPSPPRATHAPPNVLAARAFDPLARPAADVSPRLGVEPTDQPPSLLTRPAHTIAAPSAPRPPAATTTSPRVAPSPLAVADMGVPRAKPPKYPAEPPPHPRSADARPTPTLVRGLALLPTEPESPDGLERIASRRVDRSHLQGPSVPPPPASSTAAGVEFRAGATSLELGTIEVHLGNAAPSDSSAERALRGPARTAMTRTGSLLAEIPTSRAWKGLL